jgi:hypothetical protein
MKMKKLILLCTLIGLVSCSKDVTHKYAYEVSGTANNYNLTIEAAPSGTEQYSNVGSGWKYTWTQVNDNPRFLYVSAQNQNSSGTVIVKIIKDGTVIATNTSSGAYVIATVSGTY